MKPELRFEGFEGEWSEKKLGELVHFQGGGTPSKSNLGYWKEGTIPWVSSQEVRDKYISSTKYQITEKAIKESSTRLVPTDTMLIVVRSGILVRMFPISITALPMAINQDIKAINLIGDEVNQDYFYQYLKSQESFILRKIVQSGTTVHSIALKDLENLSVGYPAKMEQQKITTFFTYQDRKIAKQQEKIEKLEELKKGMIQKVLSGELRFKDKYGEEFPGWEITTFEQVSSSIKYGLNAAAKDFDGENKYIRITNIDEQTRNYIEGGKVSPSGEVTDEYLVNTGDILFARTGASTGKSYMYKETDGKMYFAGFLIKASIKSSVNHEFIYFQTLTHKYDNWVKVMSMRSGQPGINASEYASYQFELPVLSEQNKIVFVLRAMEDKISKELEKLVLLQEEKNGFMQRMFI